MSNVQQCSVKISLAGKEMSIKATHSGYKSYFIKYVTRAIRRCTTKAFFVPDLQHDLLGGRVLLTANYRVILDKDPKLSGIFSLTNGETDPATGLPFLDSEGLFFVESVQLSETQFKNMSRYRDDTLYGIGNSVTAHCRRSEIRTTCKRNQGSIKGIFRSKSAVSGMYNRKGPP